jgi:hypothetical protein
MKEDRYFFLISFVRGVGQRPCLILKCFMLSDITIELNKQTKAKQKLKFQQITKLNKQKEGKALL